MVNTEGHCFFTMIAADADADLGPGIGIVSKGHNACQGRRQSAGAVDLAFSNSVARHPLSYVDSIIAHGAISHVGNLTIAHRYRVVTVGDRSRTQCHTVGTTRLAIGSDGCAVIGSYLAIVPHSRGIISVYNSSVTYYSNKVSAGDVNIVAGDGAGVGVFENIGIAGDRVGSADVELVEIAGNGVGGAVEGACAGQLVGIAGDGARVAIVQIVSIADDGIGGTVVQGVATPVNSILVRVIQNVLISCVSRLGSNASDSVGTAVSQVVVIARCTCYTKRVSGAVNESEVTSKA